jgi:hypothetical protein
MSAKDLTRNAMSSFRIEGELVERGEGGGISIHRGGSVYEVSKEDILDVQEFEGKKVHVSVKSDAELVRTTLVRSRYFGGAVGWRPVFDDCTECCDCTECSVCSDCTECSVCADCTECSGGGGGIFRANPQSSWIRRMGGGVNRMFRGSGRG